MERVGHQSKTVDGIADDQLDEEEYAIYGQQNLYPARLGKGHCWPCVDKMRTKDDRDFGPTVDAIFYYARDGSVGEGCCIFRIYR